jgi:hypothetical protein
MKPSPNFRDFAPVFGISALVILTNTNGLEYGPGDAAFSTSSHMLQRLLDAVVLTVVAILFSAAVAVLKCRRI